jgi:orotate phosphoribosyltransferase
MKSDYEWCLEHIDKNSIWRTPNGETIPGKPASVRYTWQFYLRRSLFDPTFSHKIGNLFYEKLKSYYRSNPFQILACETAGVPVGTAIQAAFFRNGERVNMLSFRKDPKEYGLRNQLEGKLNGNPILLVDDLAASQLTLLKAQFWIIEAGLPFSGLYATVVDKKGKVYKKDDNKKPYLLDAKLISLYTLDDFVFNRKDFKVRYKHEEPPFIQL